MGCRTANGWDINHDDGVNGQTKDGRGNICPVTIIMPTLAMECRINFDADVKGHHSFDDKQILIDRSLGKLDQKIHEAKDMLIGTALTISAFNLRIC